MQLQTTGALFDLDFTAWHDAKVRARSGGRLSQSLRSAGKTRRESRSFHHHSTGHKRSLHSTQPIPPRSYALLGKGGGGSATYFLARLRLFQSATRDHRGKPPVFPGRPAICRGFPRPPTVFVGCIRLTAYNDLTLGLQREVLISSGLTAKFPPPTRARPISLTGEKLPSLDQCACSI